MPGSQKFSLTNRSVVVVGGGSGIGKAVARASAAAGAKVAIASRNLDKLAAAADEIGGNTAYAALDMTDANAVENWAGQLAGVDHLVISASSAAHGPFAELPLDALRGMFDAKFFGPYSVARAVLPKIAPGGSITFFSGVLSRRPGENCSGLGAVNGAVESLALALALELGPAIRVNCCSPGMVRSEAYAALPADAREEMYASTGASLPVGRVGETDEIAHAVLFMMTNPYLTGQVVDVDGGHMIRQYATR
ncbi:MAG: SDR family oxidoreductase [Gammaproteobacteria bacterium]|nr:SDR family oxidoreductase [Gammaproteobacteria bacterium]